MKGNIITCLFVLLFTNMKSFSQKPNGVYTFHHQEMVASFNFSEDNRFEFFYAYGASDRNASGTFTMSGDTIKLHSSKLAGKDFTVLNQSQKGKGFTITAKAPNPYLLKHILAIAFINGEQKYFESDENGIITIEAENCDSIYLQHSLFPDALTQIKNAENKNNQFEVELNPSLQQVSFKGIDLFMKGDELTCLPNYFMPMENLRFVKE